MPKLPHLKLVETLKKGDRMTFMGKPTRIHTVEMVANGGIYFSHEREFATKEGNTRKTLYRTYEWIGWNHLKIL